jgi:hypothetical protein
MAFDSESESHSGEGFLVPPAAKLEDSQTIFRPGEAVRIKGIYRVLHYAHRLPHETAVLVLKRFPNCNQCGDAVRYQLVRSVGELLKDYNFRKDVDAERSSDDDVLTE